MKSKKWIISYFLIIVIGLGCYMALSYYANPLGYFTISRGETRISSDDYNRSVKGRYVREHKDEIEAIIMGGSKAGVFSPAQLSEYSGLNYYNMYWNIGNFADYLRFTRFLAEETDIKEITLFLSSYETRAYDRTNTGTTYKAPAVLSGSPITEAIEFVSFLMSDQNTVRKALSSRTASKKTSWDNLITGSKYFLNKLNSFTKDPDAYVEKNVLHSYKSQLKKLFVKNNTAESQAETREQNLQALREIVSICEEAEINLRVVITPSIITERFQYENPEFYAYVAQITNIVGEVWDFSDFNAQNMNPYNFWNEKHFSPAMADLMIDTIYGKASVEGFGQLLTPENVQAAMQERYEQFLALQAEYEETGTIALLGMDDESYLPWSMDNLIFTQEVLPE